MSKAAGAASSSRQQHRLAFGPEGVYGKWLRSLNTEIRINDTLFVHSGISRKYCSTSIDEVNRRVREELNDPAKLPGGIVTDQEGPFWYRGLAQGDEKDMMVVVDATLENSDAKREAFGHTYAAASITPRFNGKVILLDTSLPGESGSVSSIGCLLIDEGKLSSEITVRQVFPSVAPKLHAEFRAVTLWQLMTHRAGLPDNGPWWQLSGKTATEKRHSRQRRPRVWARSS